MNDTDRQAEQLWQKFLLVTQEMHKFMNKENVDMFLELLDQRRQLQTMLEKLGNNTYHLTPAGKALIGRINPLNDEIKRRVESWLNKTKLGASRARAYDSLGMELSGSMFNQRL